MKRPPVWTREQLDEHRLIATERFRRTRMEEPLEQYLASFDESQEAIEELLEYTLDLTDLNSNIVEVLTAPKLLEAFRSMAGPPVSEDDLKVVAEATLSKTRLLSDQEAISRIRQVILSGLDRRRFPWVIEGREPTESERHAAVVASAALLATRQSQTQRRSDGKREQETAVHNILLANGFEQVPTRSVKVLNDAPGPGQFCAESELGTRKADVLIGLPDRRVMPLECKVSNSSTNSVKRLNNDAAVKAETWKKDFGQMQVVPAAVLGGVYKLRNLQDAQERGLTLFWEHKLQELVDWIDF